MMKYAPIALFCFNRLEHLTKTIQALQANTIAQSSELFVFCDGPRNEKDGNGILQVRQYVKSIDGFKSVQIIERERNLGLANSIIQGVTELAEKYGRVIVIEDDLVTSPYFLEYLNSGLETYAEDEVVASIHGWTPPLENMQEPLFFLRGADCWGWATWKRAWDHFEKNGSKLLQELEKNQLTWDFDFEGAYGYTQMLRDQIVGKNNSWAIRWHASAFLRGMLTMYPKHSLVANIGMDGSGTHCVPSNEYDTAISRSPVEMRRIPLVESQRGRAEFIRFFRGKTNAKPQRTLWDHSKDRLKALLNYLRT